MPKAPSASLPVSSGFSKLEQLSVVHLRFDLLPLFLGGGGGGGVSREANVAFRKTSEISAGDILMTRPLFGVPSRLRAIAMASGGLIGHP